jgi:putative DNA primase/helicase
VTVATIYHLAQENGWRDDAPRFIGAADTPSAKTSTPPRDAELETTFARLASLSRVEYDRAREAEAERLGIRRSTLDEEVEKYRIEDDEKPCSGRALFLPMPEPWPTPIDGSELLDALVGAVATYVRLSEAAAIAVALWCIHAHAFEVATISPRLAITSPEKRCGKTTLLRVIHGLVP